LIALTRRNDPKIIATTQNPKAWAKLYQRVVKVLPAEAANLLTLAKWRGLNERSFVDKSFVDKLIDIGNRHAITLSKEDVKVFNRIRNSIVHRFGYDDTIHLPGHWNMLKSPQTAQHFFAAEFVDRIILQLFGLRDYLEVLPKAEAELK
jgi:hypothetical protein